MIDELDQALRDHPFHDREAGDRCPLCVTCPHCWATPDQWCVNERGMFLTFMYGVHYKRMAKAHE